MLETYGFAFLIMAAPVVGARSDMTFLIPAAPDLHDVRPRDCLVSERRREVLDRRQ